MALNFNNAAKIIVFWQNIVNYKGQSAQNFIDSGSDSDSSQNGRLQPIPTPRPLLKLHENEKGVAAYTINAVCFPPIEIWPSLYLKIYVRCSLSKQSFGVAVAAIKVSENVAMPFIIYGQWC